MAAAVVVVTVIVGTAVVVAAAAVVVTVIVGIAAAVPLASPVLSPFSTHHQSAHPVNTSCQSLGFSSSSAGPVTTVVPLLSG